MSESWIDKQGDVWRLGDDGLMHSYETAPFPREYVEKKWGPLKLVAPIIICEPVKDCKDPHVLRWHCMRGHDLDAKPAVPGVCPLKVCEQRGANR